MRRARVIAAHRAPARTAIRVAAGDRVMLGAHDCDWPQFVWATASNGLGGWIPADVFDVERGSATALKDYDTRELDADPGTELALDREHADWWWATAPDGAQGWIPARVLQPID